ncbi:MarR family winged helix-turn-helix transcriptional regulator [Enterococcus sp. JM9B]|uniref:MarR family winged helix-turn-helix transcriptional regulator n=1 Tax=Enterococcus sp. JM9B TaxID=1857216 RepID=UPI00137529F4|nr:MarR family transcriptional regulator [Enterococcus sp. JM9B]KAF1303554.1 hypothetical protein BAU16_04220 [Enterococcus sp. JM9B]
MKETEIDLLEWLPIISRNYTMTLDQQLLKIGLNSSLYYYVIKLYEFGDLPQEKLVRLTGVNASNVTRAVQKLIHSGLVTKKENPDDRRGFLLSLTTDGRTLYPQILDSLEKVTADFLAPLSPQQKDIFVQSLSLLRSH